MSEPVFVSEDNSHVVIRIVGIGIGGARAVRKMTARINGVYFFGMIEESAYVSCNLAVGCDLNALPLGGTNEIEFLMETAKGTDLAFVVSFLENESVADMVGQFAEAAKSQGAAVIGVTAADCHLTRKIDHLNALIRVSQDCIVPGDEAIPLIFSNESFSDYLMRTSIERVTSLITEPGFICVDFDDIMLILANGSDTFMSIGVAGGPNKGTDAACNAINGLSAQNQDLRNATGILANISGSTNMTMEDFENALRTLHEGVPEESNTICGLLVNDVLGDYLRVTVFATYPREPTFPHRSGTR